MLLGCPLGITWSNIYTLVDFQNIEICIVVLNELGCSCNFESISAIHKGSMGSNLVEICKVPEMTKIILESIPKP